MWLLVIATLTKENCLIGCVIEFPGLHKYLGTNWRPSKTGCKKYGAQIGAKKRNFVNIVNK